VDITPDVPVALDGIDAQTIQAEWLRTGLMGF
jgi:hypothetical protein